MPVDDGPGAAAAAAPPHPGADGSDGAHTPDRGRLRRSIARATAHEGLNFALSNRVPRRALTRLVGRVARSESPFVRGPALALWRLFCDVDLSDAETTRFRSLREGFTRPLRPGARPVDPDPGAVTSPCDGVVVACGPVRGTELMQVKDRPYPLAELLRDAVLAEAHRGGTYVTLRLTAGMYHRFHAPHDCVVERVDHLPGDVWNVNPPALARVDRLYCRNERAVVRTRLVAGPRLTLVPVAAILVAGIRLHCAGGLLGERHGGPSRHDLRAPHAKGDEMGWFEHGSTIVVLAPRGLALCDDVREGATLRMGRPLMRLPPTGATGRGSAHGGPADAVPLARSAGDGLA